MRFPGVTPTGKGTFEVRLLLPRARPVFIGTWQTEREAAIVLDRLKLHVGLPRLNLPKLSVPLGPLSIEEARRLCRLAIKKFANTGSRYVGVSRTRSGWTAAVAADDRHHYRLGPYPYERDAAIARDRLVLSLPRERRFLNFPRLDLAPASFEELSRESRHLKRSRSSSGYFGVSPSHRGPSRPWNARLRVAGREVALGMWPTARAAAEAHDRAALYYQHHDCLNFPEREQELAPADAHTIRAEASRRGPKTSRYVGVCWSRQQGLWIAQVGARGAVHNLGVFRSEKQAALARDRAAIRLQGKNARLNFDPITGRALYAPPSKGVGGRPVARKAGASKKTSKFERRSPGRRGKARTG